MCIWFYLSPVFKYWEGKGLSRSTERVNLWCCSTGPDLTTWISLDLQAPWDTYQNSVESQVFDLPPPNTRTIIGRRQKSHICTLLGEQIYCSLLKDRLLTPAVYRRSNKTHDAEGEFCSRIFAFATSSLAEIFSPATTRNVRTVRIEGI